ncbi:MULTISPECIES: hypothetical protein [Gracilibacillus]|uniref:hypothetical protein n=1 Tax=Gracilibacillus TaxID=74385 RepID=UPI0006CFABBB
MKLQATNTVTDQEFAQFFENKMSWITDDRMKQYGYFVEQDEKPIAFFCLYPVDKSSYWLRAFIMKKGAPFSLPLTIIQSAENLTYNYGAEKLYVQSRSETVDQLLKQLSYQQIPQGPSTEKQGQWWINDHLNVDKTEGYTQNVN